MILKSVPFTAAIILLWMSYTPSTDALPLSKRSLTYLANETVCIVNGVIYYNGDPIPTENPCETCKCRPPGFACVLKECELKPGCKAIRKEGQCCPEYQCGCEYNGVYYKDKEPIPTPDSPCYTCSCQSTVITCALIDCHFRSDCEPNYLPGECCPRYDHCRPLPAAAIPENAVSSTEAPDTDQETPTETPLEEEEERQGNTASDASTIVDKTTTAITPEEIKYNQSISTTIQPEQIGEQETSKADFNALTDVTVTPIKETSLPEVINGESDVLSSDISKEVTETPKPPTTEGMQSTSQPSIKLEESEITLTSESQGTTIKEDDKKDSSITTATEPPVTYGSLHTVTTDEPAVTYETVEKGTSATSEFEITQSASETSATAKEESLLQPSDVEEAETLHKLPELQTETSALDVSEQPEKETVATAKQESTTDVKVEVTSIPTETYSTSVIGTTDTEKTASPSDAYYHLETSTFEPETTDISTIDKTTEKSPSDIDKLVEETKDVIIKNEAAAQKVSHEDTSQTTETTTYKGQSEKGPSASSQSEGYTEQYSPTETTERVDVLTTKISEVTETVTQAAGEISALSVEAEKYVPQETGTKESFISSEEPATSSESQTTRPNIQENTQSYGPQISDTKQSVTNLEESGTSSESLIIESSDKHENVPQEIETKESVTDLEELKTNSESQMTKSSIKVENVPQTTEVNLEESGASSESHVSESSIKTENSVQVTETKELVTNSEPVTSYESQTTEPNVREIAESYVPQATDTKGSVTKLELETSSESQTTETSVTKRTEYYVPKETDIKELVSKSEELETSPKIQTTESSVTEHVSQATDIKELVTKSEELLATSEAQATESNTKEPSLAYQVDESEYVTQTISKEYTSTNTVNNVKAADALATTSQPRETSETETTLPFVDQTTPDTLKSHLSQLSSTVELEHESVTNQGNKKESLSLLTDESKLDFEKDDNHPSTTKHELKSETFTTSKILVEETVAIQKEQGTASDASDDASTKISQNHATEEGKVISIEHYSSDDLENNKDASAVSERLEDDKVAAESDVKAVTTECAEGEKNDKLGKLTTEQVNEESSTQMEGRVLSNEDDASMIQSDDAEKLTTSYVPIIEGNETISSVDKETTTPSNDRQSEFSSTILTLTDRQKSLSKEFAKSESSASSESTTPEQISTGLHSAEDAQTATKETERQRTEEAATPLPISTTTPCAKSENRASEKENASLSHTDEKLGEANSNTDQASLYTSETAFIKEVHEQEVRKSEVIKNQAESASKESKESQNQDESEANELRETKERAENTTGKAEGRVDESEDKTTVASDKYEVDAQDNEEITTVDPTSSTSCNHEQSGKTEKDGQVQKKTNQDLDPEATEHHEKTTQYVDPLILVVNDEGDSATQPSEVIAKEADPVTLSQKHDEKKDDQQKQTREYNSDLKAEHREDIVILPIEEQEITTQSRSQDIETISTVEPEEKTTTQKSSHSSTPSISPLLYVHMPSSTVYISEKGEQDYGIGLTIAQTKLPSTPKTTTAKSEESNSVTTLEPTLVPRLESHKNAAKEPTTADSAPSALQDNDEAKLKASGNTEEATTLKPIPLLYAEREQEVHKEATDFTETNESNSGRTTREISTTPRTESTSVSSSFRTAISVVTSIAESA